MKQTLARLLLIGACLQTNTSWAANTPLDFIANGVGFERQSQVRQFDKSVDALRQGEFDRASKELVKLRDRIGDDTAPESLAAIDLNLGLAAYGLGRITEALALVQQSITQLDTSAGGAFHAGLIDPLMVQALVLKDLGELDAAEESMRRAQHITHRESGVYTREQMPILDEITRLNEMQGKVFAADREQRFKLKVAEEVYGENSEALVPILESLGEMFARRGNQITHIRPFQEISAEQDAARVSREALFRESIAYHERAIRILENNYGENDFRVVESLRALSKSRLRQRSNRHAELAMQRAYDIVQNSPSADFADRVKITLDLADVYTITGDSRAADLYLDAWQKLSSEPGYEQSLLNNFGTPIRLVPEEMTPITLDRYPMDIAPDQILTATAEFRVLPNGKVRDVDIVDGNIPNRNRHLLRERLKQARFRPRIKDGELVETPGLSVTQMYVVEERAPETSVSFDVHP